MPVSRKSTKTLSYLQIADL